MIFFFWPGGNKRETNKYEDYHIRKSFQVQSYVSEIEYVNTLEFNELYREKMLQNGHSKLTFKNEESVSQPFGSSYDRYSMKQYESPDDISLKQEQRYLT